MDHSTDSATEAIKSYNANVADKSKDCVPSTEGGNRCGALGASGSATDPTVKKAEEGQETPTPKKPVPLADAIGAMMTMGDFAVRAISVDASDSLKNKILLRDDYEGTVRKGSDNPRT